MTPAETRLRPLTWLLLLLIVAGGAYLRYLRVGLDAVSLDEMWHLVLSTGRGSPQMTWPGNEVIHVDRSFSNLPGAPAWWAVWTNMDRVLHPPLFVMTLRWWRNAFGDGDVAAQWYVAAWSLVIVGMTFDIARTLSRGRVAPALWAAAIVAVSPTQILLSQELRAYAMLTGLACCAIAAAARIDVRGYSHPRVAAVGACALAMMLTHYFALGVCAAIGLWAILRLRGRALVGVAVSLAVAAGVFLAAWGPFMIRQIPDIAHTADPWLKDPSPNAFWWSLGRFFAMPIRLLVDRDYPSLVWPALGAAAMLVAVARLRAGRRELLLPVLWFACACGFLLALDWARGTRHLVYIRYSLPAAPAVAVVAVLACARRRSSQAPRDAAGSAPNGPPGFSPVVHVVGAGLVGLLLWQNPAANFADEPDYRVLRRFMLDRAAAAEPMLFFSGPQVKGYFNEILMLAASREPALFPRAMVKLMRPADAALVAALPGPTAWLFSGPVESVPAILPGVTVLEQRLLTDAEDRPVAVCTHVRLPDHPTPAGAP